MPTGEIPPIGLGTWQNKGPQCAKSVETALNAGYRHIDTAQLYDNEEQVGRGIAQSDVPRDDVTLATKVWTDRLTRDGVLNSTAESLEKLGTDYVDILYVHWPADTYDAADTMAAFDQLVDDGKVKHIAVSNFTPDLVDEARQYANHPILANQVDRSVLIERCSNNLLKEKVVICTPCCRNKRCRPTASKTTPTSSPTPPSPAAAPSISPK